MNRHDGAGTGGEGRQGVEPRSRRSTPSWPPIAMTPRPSSEAHAELDRDVRHAGAGTPRRLLGHPLKVRAIAEAGSKRIGSTRRSWRTSCAVICCRPRTSGRGSSGSANRFLRQRMFMVRVRTMVKNRIHVSSIGNSTSAKLPCSSATSSVALAWRGCGRWVCRHRTPVAERRARPVRKPSRSGLPKRQSWSGTWRRGIRACGGCGPFRASDAFFAVLVVTRLAPSRRFSTPEKLSAYAGLVLQSTRRWQGVFTGASRSKATSGCVGPSSRRCRPA